jgi:hypothetical protein
VALFITEEGGERGVFYLFHLVAVCLFSLLSGRVPDVQSGNFELFRPSGSTPQRSPDRRSCHMIAAPNVAHFTRPLKRR